MRYRKYVSPSIHDLAQLIVAWSKFAEEPETLGECILGTTYPDIIKQIDQQSDIKVTPKQLYDLCWYFKNAILEKLKHNHKKLPDNYNYLMKRLNSQIPQLFVTAPSGEVLIKQGNELTGRGEEDDEL